MSATAPHPDIGSPPEATAAPPHVVHVIDELPADGAERLIADLVANRSPHFRYSVLCIVAGGPLVAEIEAAGVPVSVLSRQPGLDIGTLPALYRWLRLHRVDVVHTHLFAADSYGRLAALLARVPVIVSTRHSTGAWAGYGRRTLSWFLGSTTSRTIACGEAVGRFLHENERIPPRKTRVIPNGINLARLAGADRRRVRLELGLPPDKLLIGVVGRLSAAKGHVDLLAALSGLVAAPADWFCVFIGGGELHAEISADVQRLGLGAHVRLLGHRSDIPDVLAALDVLVLSSRWEGLPMALLEGMAVGLAVVSTSVGSIPEVIEQGKNGLLVPPRNPDSLSRELHRLLIDPELRSRLGAAARATVVRRFDAASTVRAYEDLYLELLGPRRRMAASSGAPT